MKSKYIDINFEQIHYSIPYYPYYHGHNDRNSEILLRYKFGDPGAFKFVNSWLRNHIFFLFQPQDTYVVPIPSSKANITNAITRTQVWLCKEYPNLIEGEHLLKRISTIRPKHLSTYSDYAYELFKSIEIDPAVSGKNILLIDDICTTGKTMDLIGSKLVAMGVKSISRFAIGKTIKY